ncbi:SO_0444 family Cu/Zn efflux transporter [Hydrogenimonas sp.]
MELAGAYLSALWELTAAMAPYILLGLFVAGVLHAVLPGDFVQKHLGRNTAASVFKATLLGIPLPLCSCGVIPLAASLKKKGAEDGAVLSFLIATPITGIDSILATYGMFGWLFTLYRIASSLVIALVAGLWANFFNEKGEVKSETFEDASSCCGQSCGCESEKKRGFDFREAMRYGFGTLMGDIAKPLLWGLLIGAAITVAIPDNLSAWMQAHTWLGYLLAIVVAVPMYVCATASLPIAASLVLGGVSLGAAFVFLSAGPATNTVTIGVVQKMLGKRALVVYLATIVAGSLLFGALIDTLFSNLDPATLVHLETSPGLLNQVASIILWGLILKPAFTSSRWGSLRESSDRKG